MDLTYTQGTASQQDIYLHLQECGPSFIPPLEERVNLKEYSSKIFNNAVTFETWNNHKLVGLLAAYFNNTDERKSYITSVSTLKTYTGMRIASSMLQRCIDYAKQRHFEEISLEVAKANKKAVSLYEKFDFQSFKDKQGQLIMTLSL